MGAAKKQSFFLLSDCVSGYEISTAPLGLSARITDIGAIHGAKRSRHPQSLQSARSAGPCLDHSFAVVFRSSHRTAGARQRVGDDVAGRRTRGSGTEERRV